MGIHSRDYIRNQPAGELYGGAAGDLWAIKFLLIANIAVFFLQNASLDLDSYLSLALPDLFPSGQIWRLVTYGFCHAGLNHIAFNMLALWIFGRMVEPIYGSREFLGFYLAAVVISGVCHLAMQAAQSAPAVGVIGASGGVMAVTFLAAMHFPRATILLMFVLPIQLRWLAVLYAAADLMGMIDGHSGIAHAAHLGGAAFGVAYKHFNWRVTRFWQRAGGSMRGWKLRTSRPKVRLYKPPQENLEAQVDAILAKIYEHGEESLTDQERETLKAASQQYKNKL